MLWKIFSSVLLCSWKYYRKHIFYLLLTFSHIFSASKQINNIISQSTNPKETKPKKKNSSNPVKLREGRERGDWVRSRGEIARRRRRRDRVALESIFAWSAQCCDRRDRCDRRSAAIDETGAIGAVWVVGLELGLWLSDWSSVYPCSLSLSLSLCAFEARSENGLKWK